MKQEVLIEDVAAIVTLQHRAASPIRVHPGTGVRVVTDPPPDADPDAARGPGRTGTLHAVEMDAISNTGAYGAHALTVTSNTGSKTLPLYNRAPHVAFSGRVVYTNLPVADAYCGYGGNSRGRSPSRPQWTELADRLGIDAVVLRERNHIRTGETSPIFGGSSAKVARGRRRSSLVRPRRMSTPGFRTFRLGGTADPPPRGWPGAARVGMSAHMQGSGIALIDMAAATVTMNDDGSFNLLTGSTDLGTGSTPSWLQIAAEVLGIGIDAVLVIAADTDLTRSTRAPTPPDHLCLRESRRGRRACGASPNPGGGGGDALRPGPRISRSSAATSRAPGIGVLADIGRRSYYGPDPGQIAATASFVPEASPPPFMAAFAGVEVDVETGLIRVTDFLAAVDCGTAVNPLMTEGQVEGVVANGIGYALTEEMQFTARSRTPQPRPRPLQDPRRRRPPADHRDARGLLRADRADGGRSRLPRSGSTAHFPPSPMPCITPSASASPGRRLLPKRCGTSCGRSLQSSVISKKAPELPGDWGLLSVPDQVHELGPRQRVRSESSVHRRR